MDTRPLDVQQVQSERERREQLEGVVSSLQATTAIAQALGGETDLDIVLDLIVTRGRELVVAIWAAILILDGDDLELRATAGDMPMRPIGHRYVADETLAGQVMRTGKPRTVSDLSRYADEEDRELVVELGAEQALLVPLEFRGRSVGVLMVAASETEGFTADQEHLLEAFAASAATAIATAQTVAADHLRQSAAAAEQERRRWARELHDETLQELGAARMLIDSARSGRKVALAEVLDQVAQSLDATIAGLHRMITELRPAALDALGVEAAIQALAERRRTPELGVAVTVDLDYEAGRQPTRLAPEVESAVYRIVQEALANIHKHAQATCAEVYVREVDGQVEVEVRDDGRGLGSSDTSGTGFGLAGMRERAALIGGSLDIGSTATGGTVVRATLPALHVPPGAGGA